MSLERTTRENALGRSLRAGGEGTRGITKSVQLHKVTRKIRKCRNRIAHANIRGFYDLKSAHALRSSEINGVELGFYCSHCSRRLYFSVYWENLIRHSQNAEIRASLFCFQIRFAAEFFDAYMRPVLIVLISHSSRPSSHNPCVMCLHYSFNPG